MGRGPSCEELLRELRENSKPRKRSAAITPNSSSYRTTIDKDAVEESGRDPDEPGEASQYVYDEYGVIVIDLQGDLRV